MECEEEEKRRHVGEVGRGGVVEIIRASEMATEFSIRRRGGKPGRRIFCAVHFRLRLLRLVIGWLFVYLHVIAPFPISWRPGQKHNQDRGCLQRLASGYYS